MFKKITAVICAAMVGIFSVIPAFAASRPAIYKVSDNSGHNIYMMGTFHYSDDDTFPIEGIDKVLDDVDTVAFEISQDDMEKYAEKLRAEKEEKTETETNGLSDDMLDELSSFIKEANGREYTREELSTISLADINSLLSQAVLIKEGYSVEGTEEYLDKLAKEKNLKTVSLEDPAKSMEQLKSHTDKDMKITEASKEEAAEAASSKFRMMMFTSFFQGLAVHEMVKAWANGNVEDLRELLSAMNDHSEEMAERDGLFLNTAKNYLANGEKVLIAVGAAHVIGNETGLVKTLTEEGYTVERI